MIIYYYIQTYIYIFSCPEGLAGSLVPDQECNPGLTVKAPCPSHWTAREFRKLHTIKQRI